MILVFGKKGQLATALTEHLPRDTVFRSHEECDFRDSTQVLQTLQQLNPQIVINTSAYTQVDRAQTEVDACTKINATAVGLIANWCAGHGKYLVQISTDYVFDGRKTTPYREGDDTHPLNIYGSTKLLAEHLITKQAPAHVILRTAWLFHESGDNFIKTMLKYGREKSELRVVDDQISSPTYTGDLAQAIAKLLQQSERPQGIYHLASRGFCNRLELMNTVFEIARAWDPQLKAQLSPAKSTDFPTPAERPLSTKLDTSLIEKEHGLMLRPWRNGVEECLRRLYKI